MAGQRANEYVEIAAAVAIQVSDGTGVRAAPGAFQLRDDFHAAHLGAAGNRAARKQGAYDLDGGRILAEAAADIRDDVMHMRVGLENHVLVDANATTDTDAAEVVALEIDQHHVLGALL